MKTTIVKIKDIVENIVDNRGRNPDKYYELESVPVIDNFMIKNTFHPNLASANRFLDEKQYLTFLRGYIEENDLLITLVGNGIGNVTLAPRERAAIVQNTIGLKTIKEKVNNVFLYYYLCLINQSIRNLDRGSSQPSVNRKDLLNLKIEISELEYQNRIAEILEKYDKLIENNQNQIKILEEMAETLYKEWFVHFRFPGYEKFDFHEGIPTIWNYEKIGDIMTFDRGISYSSEEIDCDEGLNLINLKNIQSFGGFRRDGTKKYNGKYKKSQVVKENDLIMGVTDMTQERRTVGSVALIPNIEGTSVISADLVKVNSKIDNVFLYTMFRFGNISKYLSQFGNGANVIHLKPDTIKNKKILMPDEKTLKAFTDKIKPIITQLNYLNNQNDNLIEQRDLLLPRLMSGKLEIN